MKLHSIVVRSHVPAGISKPYDPTLLKFSSSSVVDAFNQITADTVGPKIVRISNQMRCFLLFAVVVCTFPVFHMYYKINAPSASMAVLVLTGIAVLIAMSIKIYYSNLPAPSAGPITIQNETSASLDTDSSGSVWSDVLSGIRVGSYIMKDYNPPTTSGPPIDAVYSIRQTWAQMKADESIKQAVDSFHMSMQVLVMIPILVTFGAGFHVSYRGAQYETIAASISIIVGLIVFSTNYAAYSNYK